MSTHYDDQIGELDARTQAAEPLGLSIGTNLTAPYLIEYSADGRLCRGIPIRSKKRPQVGGGTRERIAGFSRKSRHALLCHLNSLRTNALSPALFITLTYPEGEVTPQESKRHLDVMLKRIRRKFPNAAYIWKLEYQENLTAHYHILLLGVPFWLFLDLQRAWAEIVKSNHPAHERVGTNVQLVANQKHASCYMGKYVSKETRIAENHYGRFWGVGGAIEKYAGSKAIQGLDRNQYVRLRRLFDAIRKSNWRKGIAKRRERGAPVKPFRRASDLRVGQSWFLDGVTVTLAVDRLFGLNPAILRDALGVPSPLS